MNPMTPTQALDILRDTALARARAFGPDDSSVVTTLEMRKCVQALMQAQDALATALRDALATFRTDGRETLITAERQEAWHAALDRHQPAPTPNPSP